MKKLSEYMKEKFMLDDPDDVISVIAEYLEDKAAHIEDTEPYATKTIERLREAAYAVREIEYAE